jgi:hypothetical protein
VTAADADAAHGFGSARSSSRVRSVTANFARRTFTLTVAKQGTGADQFASSPVGLPLDIFGWVRYDT